MKWASLGSDTGHAIQKTYEPYSKARTRGPVDGLSVCGRTGPIDPKRELTGACGRCLAGLHLAWEKGRAIGAQVASNSNGTATATPTNTSTSEYAGGEQTGPATAGNGGRAPDTASLIRRPPC